MFFLGAPPLTIHAPTLGEHTRPGNLSPVRGLMDDDMDNDPGTSRDDSEIGLPKSAQCDSTQRHWLPIVRSPLQAR